MQPDLADSYLENSPVVLGYGAAIANDRPRNGMALHLDNQLWINDPAVAPLGMQKFAWDPSGSRFDDGLGARRSLEPQLDARHRGPAIASSTA